MMHTPPPEDNSGHALSPHRKPPTKPRPSEDKGFLPPTQAPKNEPDAIPPDAASVDINTLSPLAALKLLTAAAEAYVRASQVAVPLTPPTSGPNTPRVAGVGDLHQQQIPLHPSPPLQGENSSIGATVATSSDNSQQHDHHHDPNSPNSHHHHDVPPPHKTPIGSPETHPSSTSPPSDTAEAAAGAISSAPPAPPKEPFSISSAPTSTTPTGPATTTATTNTSTAPNTDATTPAQASDPEHEEQLAQYRRLTIKFFSKKPPPISLGDYLHRLHKYCPMSTAVYLAAAWYMVRLSGTLLEPPNSGTTNNKDSNGKEGDEQSGEAAAAAAERAEQEEKEETTDATPEPGGAHSVQQQPWRTTLLTRLRSHSEKGTDPLFPIPVAPKSVHRLLLAVLRVATKTLEDRTFPHARVARVGGVGDRELARLEESGTFLLEFELLVREDVLGAVARWLVEGWWGGWGEGR